jgi:hypothetical protein
LKMFGCVLIRKPNVSWEIEGIPISMYKMKGCIYGY